MGEVSGYIHSGNKATRNEDWMVPIGRNCVRGAMRFTLNIYIIAKVYVNKKLNFGYGADRSIKLMQRERVIDSTY